MTKQKNNNIPSDFGSVQVAHISQSGGCPPLRRDAQPKTVATGGVARAEPPQKQAHRPTFHLYVGGKLTVNGCEDGEG